MSEGDYIRSLLSIDEQDEETRHELLTRLGSLTSFKYTGRGEPPTVAYQKTAPFLAKAWGGGTFHLYGVQVEAFVAGSCAGLLSTAPRGEALNAVLDPEYGIIRSHWELPNVGNCHLGPHGQTPFLVAYQIALTLPRPTARIPLEDLLLDVLA